MKKLSQQCIWVIFALLPLQAHAQIGEAIENWWQDFTATESTEEKIEKLYEQIFPQMGIEDMPDLYLPPETAAELCGQEASVNDDINAYYCLTNRSISFTRAFIDELNKPNGIVSFSSVAFVLAHELAHARQHEITGFTSANLLPFVLIDELQADCIAGAVLNLSFPGDRKLYEQSRESAYDFGDYYLSWDHHGVPDLREFVFRLGYALKDPDLCLSHPAFDFEDPKPIDFVTEFPREFIADLELADVEAVCEVVKEFTSGLRRRTAVNLACFAIQGIFEPDDPGK